ncbi:MAG: hypothetical protein NCA08_01425 [Deltaproteobacteria bacterium]|nr:hypothetical protein [Candidatus Deferrimicrobium borealis]
MRKPLAISLMILLAACSMPSTVVKTPDTRPSLAFEGAPEGAVLFLDGVRTGPANQYDGQPNILLVEPGTHLVTIKGADGAILLEQKVFVESELKTLKVH